MIVKASFDFVQEEQPRDRTGFIFIMNILILADLLFLKAVDGTIDMACPVVDLKLMSSFILMDIARLSVDH